MGFYVRYSPHAVTPRCPRDADVALLDLMSYENACTLLHILIHVLS